MFASSGMRQLKTWKMQTIKLLRTMLEFVSNSSQIFSWQSMASLLCRILKKVNKLWSSVAHALPAATRRYNITLPYFFSIIFSATRWTIRRYSKHNLNLLWNTLTNSFQIKISKIKSLWWHYFFVNAEHYSLMALFAPGSKSNSNCFSREHIPNF